MGDFVTVGRVKSDSGAVWCDQPSTTLFFLLMRKYNVNLFTGMITYSSSTVQYIEVKPGPRLSGSCRLF